MSQDIRAIDYDWLATLAKRHDVPFERLCKRAEKHGARTEDELLVEGLLPPTRDWLTTPQAASVLALTYSSFVSALMGGRLPYFGLDHRSRSRTKPNARRGCGVLFKRKDVEEVRRLRRVLGVSAKTALRVFQAKREDLL
jgi:hypothetical protein